MMLSMRSSESATWSTQALSASLYRAYKAMQKLSSGFAINSAADDPAGLVISEQLRSRIASIDQEIDNISMAIGKYDTVSSDVQGLRSDLTGLRSLAIAAANEAVNSPEAQQALNNAAQQIVHNYNRVIENASYNGRPTLNGAEGSLANLSDLNGIDLSSAESAAASIDRIEQAMGELDTTLADLGATVRNDLERRRFSLEVTQENLIASESMIRDTDFVSTYSDFVLATIQAQASVAMLSHTLKVNETLLGLFRS